MAVKIKLSTSAKKVVNLVNQTVADIYKDAVNVKNDTWFGSYEKIDGTTVPGYTSTKPVSAIVFKNKIAEEAGTIIKQTQTNMSDEDKTAVNQAVSQLLEEYGNSYEKIYNQNGYRFGFTADYKYDADPYSEQVGTSQVGILTTPVYATFIDGKALNKNISGWAGTNNTYSMCDIVCSIDIGSIGGEHVYTTLGKLQTLSYSIYQQKQPVRVLGNMNAKDYVYGQRTIAGSLVFAVFNRHWLVDVYDELVDKGMMKNWHYVADELPPFDITISFANEYGYDSKMALYGVRLMTEGQVMSINDIYIENTYQFVATDIEYMDALSAWQQTNKYGRRFQNTKGMIASGEKTVGQQDPSLVGKTPEQNNVPDKQQKPTGSIWAYLESDLANMKESEALSLLQKSFEAQQKVIKDALAQAKTEGNTEQVADYTKALEQLSKEYQAERADIQNYYAKQKVDKAKSA